MAVGESASPKGSPDLSKLQAMQDPMVVVTKGRKGASRSILAGQRLKVPDILALHKDLPLSFGPGIYKFEVTDAAGDGTGKDAWTAQLGGEVGEIPTLPVVSNEFGEGAFPMTVVANSVTPPTMSAANAAAMGVPMPPAQPTMPIGMSMPTSMNGGMGGMSPGAMEGSRQIGPGWWYNETLGMLINRNGELHAWRTGMPLPGSAVATPPAASPWGAGAMAGGLPPWGTMPVTEDPRLVQLEAQLREAREDVKERARQAELQVLRDAMTKLADAFLAKPTGPSENERALQAQVEAQQRATETLRQESAQREFARQQDDNRRRDEDARRVEFNAVVANLQAQIKEGNTSKVDPMITMITQMMNAQQTASTTMLQAVQNAALNGAEVARESNRQIIERLSSSQMTPERMMDVLKVAKDRGPEAEMGKLQVGMFKDLLNMSQDMNRQIIDANSGGQQPVWVGLLQQTLEKGGAIAQQLALTRANEVARQERQEREQRRQDAIERQRRLEQTTTPAQARTQIAAVASAKAPAKAVDARTSSQTERDAIAARMFPTATQGSAAAERDAAAATVFRAADHAPLHAVSDIEDGEDEEYEDGEDEDEEDEEDEIVAAKELGVDVAKIKPMDISKVSPAVIRKQIKKVSDADFFGASWPHVQDLRKSIMAGEIEPEAAATFIAQACAQLQSFGQVPPAVELLFTGHIDIAIERLAPDAPARFRTLLIALVQEGIDNAAPPESGN